MEAALREQRSHVWARDPDDWYVEPAWTAERLFQVEPFVGRIWDPACGIGTIVKAAQAFGYDAAGSDKIARSECCVSPMDFLDQVITLGENIVCNPPFGIAQRFVELALQRAAYKVAMLLPSDWLHGDKRSRWLEGTPLYRVWFLTPRPSMPPGRVIQAGLKPGGGKEDFAWFVWLKGFDGQPSVRWLRKNAEVVG